MSYSQPTLEDIWKLFQETDQIFKETARRFQETDLKFQETDRKFQETERIIKESNQETERIIKETSQETSLKMQESDRQFQEKIKQVNESIGRLGNKLGDFVEEMVRPAAVRLFRERGIDVHEVHQNISSQRGGEGIEIDLLVVNDTDIIAIECKSSLSIDDINDHLHRLAKIKRLLPSYANKRVLGAVTGMVIPDNVAQYAYRQGLFVIAQTGDHLTIRNDPHFQAKTW
ncbi:MAG: hypothetical protein PHH59_11335 [Methylovulum sp.]|uniref:hypothetical protein n=1 Tax=Methylovulum sp. TaxID=1916980 RepID=UPI002625B508|nr:hypothetical protein [Methylovulum sp.]MDD2724598.1 hypothetical protein [Methylovulum sp.]MDD5126069.1 hypothetical protein [Methylovulum sp.]